MKDGDMSSFSFNLEPTVDLTRQPCGARVTRHSRTLALLNRIQTLKDLRIVEKHPELKVQTLSTVSIGQDPGW